MSKYSKHWIILTAAIFFDILGLIPFLSVIFNLIFGAALFLYFGPKKLKKTMGIIIIGSIFDSVISILPVNTTATIVRIRISE